MKSSWATTGGLVFVAFGLGMMYSNRTVKRRAAKAIIEGVLTYQKMTEKAARKSLDDETLQRFYDELTTTLKLETIELNEFSKTKK